LAASADAWRYGEIKMETNRQLVALYYRILAAFSKGFLFD
jgi:hypothetical protein